MNITAALIRPSAFSSAARPRPLRLASLLLPLALLQAGCASYAPPSSLKPGASSAEVEKAMGKPTGSYELPEGGKRLEYARGPQGQHTFMMDLDAQGRLVKSEQVLTRTQFEAVRTGDSQAKVLMRLGHPAEARLMGHGDYMQPVWSYRFDSTPFCLWFQINFDAQQRVVDGSYAPDPVCEPKD